VAEPLIYGLVGHSISYSLSPRLHEAAFAFCGLAGEYRLFDTTADELKKRIADLKAAGVRGFNVTIPHKQALFGMVEARSPEAELVGALNVVKVRDDGYLEGHNTDYRGLKLSLIETCPGDFKGRNALVLGAGGAALAAAAVVRDLGFARLHVLARHREKQMAFIDSLKKRWHVLDQSSLPGEITVEPDRRDLRPQLDLVLNATSLGLRDEPEPDWMIDLIGQLPAHCLCFDIVYRRDGSMPMFAKLAQRRGLRSSDGIDMLVHQAKLSFEYWTGVTVPFEHMKKAVR
jgi:shikimate dehydrogenase